MSFKKKRQNGYGNIYGKQVIVNQQIYINSQNQSEQNPKYVSEASIRALDKMIDELVIMESFMYGHSKDEVIRKYRGYIKNNFGDGAYNKLTSENFEKAKNYLLNKLYIQKDYFAVALFNRIKKLKPE